MKYLATLLLIFGFGLSGFGQTIKTLGYNTTNGQVVANTDTNILTFTNNSIKFNGTIKTDQSVESDNFLFGTNNHKIKKEAFLGTGESYISVQIGGLEKIFIRTNSIDFLKPIDFYGSTNNSENAAITRTNLGIPSRYGLAGSSSTIGGGTSNSAEKNDSTIGGGKSNIVIAEFGTIGGGFSNRVTGWYGVIGGGNSNVAQGGFDLGQIGGFEAYSSILGGYRNSAGTYGSVGGGFSNNASGTASVVSGGWGNLASGNYSFAAGFLAKATNSGSFVWSSYNTNNAEFGSQRTNSFNIMANGGMSLDLGAYGIEFRNSTSAVATRINLGFSTNLNTLWAATNASNARSAIGIGDTNAVAFSGIYNNGNFTNINGTIYGLKTNVGPFEGIGNFFASNNTTVSNETLFRVGLAEATNKSAQFGFRVTRTNNGGEGVAVYSVFGYNALMMIGPSDRSRINYATNTNAGVEATLWTITPTNQVMTLRDTNTGATTLHQSLGFDTNVTSTAPANTTNIVKWIEVWVGTNSYRMPLYQ